MERVFKKGEKRGKKSGEGLTKKERYGRVEE
jgi:hypothetical protein